MTSGIAQVALNLVDKGAMAARSNSLLGLSNTTEFQACQAMCFFLRHASPHLVRCAEFDEQFEFAVEFLFDFLPVERPAQYRTKPAEEDHAPSKTLAMAAAT